MYSLRTRLILATTIGTAGVISTVGVFLYLFVRADLVTQSDGFMVNRARLLASAVEVEFGEVDPEFDEFDMRESDAPEGPEYIEMRLADGSVAFRSPSLRESHLDPVAGTIESPGLRRVMLPGGRFGRAVGFAFTPWSEYGHLDEEGAHGEAGDARAATMTIVLARDTASMEATLYRLRTLLLLAGLFTILASAVVLWSVIRRSLRPVDRLAAQISRLGEEDLSERIETRGVPSEIQPVTERLNGLLCRLEAAFGRERSFSADVAHELRTPLAGLRSTVEVALSRPRGGEAYREALSDCLQIVQQMQGMVEKLLSLARLDAGQVPVESQPLSLNDMVRSCWRSVSGAAEARGLRVQLALVLPPIAFATDPALLELAVQNMVENAVTYADDGGTVKIETAAGEDGSDVRVTNSGSTLTQEDAEHVCERFWRGDAARSSAGGRCGLGLALVAKIAEALGGAVAVRSCEGGDFQVALSIPNERSN